MTTRTSALLILHPRAHRHKQCDELMEHLKERFDLTVEKSKYAGHTREHARECLADFQGIYFTAGGDGTFHEAINGWADLGFPSGPRFCPLPLGTGNDFLASVDKRLTKTKTYLTHPLELEKSADLGLVHYEHEGYKKSRYFCVGATAGFSAVVTQQRNKLADKIPGALSYLVGMALSLFFWKNRKLRLESMESPLASDTFFNFNAANVKYYGGGMISSPKADPFSGCINAVSMHLTLAEVFRALPENFKGRFERVANVHLLSLAEPFVVECYPDCPVQADGELLGHTPMEIQCLPGQLPILLPQLPMES